MALRRAERSCRAGMSFAAIRRYPKRAGSCSGSRRPPFSAHTVLKITALRKKRDILSEEDPNRIGRKQPTDFVTKSVGCLLRASTNRLCKMRFHYFNKVCVTFVLGQTYHLLSVIILDTEFLIFFFCFMQQL